MTARLQRRTILLTTALTLVLGACSSASTPAPADAATGGPLAPCSLLTQAEVDTAAGQSLGPGAQAGALDDCQWSNSDFSGSVELEVGDWSAIKAKQAGPDGLLHAGPLGSGPTLTSVPGVGDEAWTFNAAGSSAQLYVRKGTTGFMLLLGGGQYLSSLADLGLAREKALASAVLGRL